MSDPTPRYPLPDDRETMTEEEIGQWYKDRLSVAEFRKFTAFSVVLNQLYGGAVPEGITIQLMNAFHIDPGEVTEITTTSERLDLDPDLDREVNEEIADSA